MATTETLQTAWRTCSMYTFGEAARIADISAMTVRNWVLGNPLAQGGARPPLLTTKRVQGPLVSFLQLVEIIVAARLRKAEGATFAAVRKAHANAQQELGFEHPFAHLDLLTIGSHISNVIRSDGEEESFQALDEPTQWTLPGVIALESLSKNELDYEEKLAARWWPGGRGSLIVVDPRISAGAPTIAGRGVTAAAVWSRFHKAQESLEFIMRDYQLEQEQVEAALRYGERLAA